jgi:hypothetical protein
MHHRADRLGIRRVIPKATAVTEFGSFSEYWLAERVGLTRIRKKLNYFQ